MKKIIVGITISLAVLIVIILNINAEGGESKSNNLSVVLETEEGNLKSNTFPDKEEYTYDKVVCENTSDKVTPTFNEDTWKLSLNIENREIDGNFNCSIYFKENKEKLTGEAIITGTPNAGNTLTVIVSNLNNENINYQWYRKSNGVETIIEGETSRAYTVTSNDVGSRIFCKITSDETTGEIVSTETSVVSSSSTSGFNVKDYYVVGQNNSQACFSGYNPARDPCDIIGGDALESGGYEVVSIDYLNNLFIENNYFNGMSYTELLQDEEFLYEALNEKYENGLFEGDIFIIDITTVLANENAIWDDGLLDINYLNLSILKSLMGEPDTRIVILNYSPAFSMWQASLPLEVNYEDKTIRVSVEDLIFQ